MDLFIDIIMQQPTDSSITDVFRCFDYRFY